MKRDDIPGYVFDALDPEEQRQIEERSELDPELARKIDELWKVVSPLAADDRIEPPSGLASRTFAFVSASTEPSVTYVARDWATPKNTVRPLDFIVAATLFGLVSILAIPAIVRLRGDQDRIMCADHLRTIGIALAMYAEVDGGYLPYVPPEGPLNNAGAFAVMLNTRELLPDRQTLVCPSANSAVVTVPSVDTFVETDLENLDLEHVRRHMAGSFGYVLGYFDGNVYRGYTARDDKAPVVADRPPRPEEAGLLNSPNHQDRGQNVLFAGGNVRWLPEPVLANDDLFHNRNGQIAAGLSPDDVVIGVSEATPGMGL